MLYQAIKTETGSALSGAVAPFGQPSLAMTLVAGLRRSLDEDPILARHYLERLAALLQPEVRHCELDQALVPATFINRPRNRKGGLAPWQERRVLEHIEENLGCSIVAEDLASVAGLSTGHFTRAFKTSTGETPHSYLIRQRVRRAQILMRESNESLSQIAFACGLTDQAHLTRLFRSIVGTTPTAWRRAWRQPSAQ